MMDVRRPISAVGGLLLVVASFLSYGYETWGSGSLFSLMRDVVTHLKSFLINPLFPLVNFI